MYLLTKGSPHPVSLGEGVDDDRQPHGGHHAQVRKGQVHHEHVRGCPQTLDLEEDVADASITEEVDQPEEEETDADNVIDQRMLRRELTPVLVYHLHGHLVHTIKMSGALGVDQVVVSIHVDAGVGSPRHDEIVLSTLDQ